MEFWNEKLLTAAQNNDISVVRDCIAHGAAVNSTDSYGQTPLHKAAAYGNTEIVGTLISYGANVDIKNKKGHTPLHLSAAYGRTDTAGLLITKDANVGIKENNGWTPLHEAAGSGRTEIVRLLIARVAILDIQNNNGHTPLHLAAANDRIESVDLLIINGANVDIKENNGWTPLHEAAGSGRTEIARLLIARGAILDIQNNNGHTPLHLAAVNGRIESVDLLIKNGANVGIHENNGQTPYDLAKTDEIKELLKIFRDGGVPRLDTGSEKASPALVGNQIFRDGGVQHPDQDVILPGINDAEEFKFLLTKGTYESHENRIYLGGACNVGKSTLASLLLGDDIPSEWNSTDGIRIYFGRNGIDLAKRIMVPLKKDEGNQNILSSVLRGNPEMEKREPFTVQKQQEKGFSMSKLAHNVNSPPLAIPEIKCLESAVLKLSTGVQSICSVHEKQKILTEKINKQEEEILNRKFPSVGFITIHDDIKQQLRKGEYKVKIAPSDLVDFGGQRSYDMTHQLFIQGKGTFNLIFDGRKGLCDSLAEYPQGDVTTKSILKHWVDSILTYCGEDDDDILPIILFVATHRDQLTEVEQSLRMTEFKKGLKDMFQNHERKNRIKYDDIFFINGTDINDVEVTRLKAMYVDIAFKQKSWGKRLPMAWVPLELQMSEMRAQKISLISKNDMIQINKENDDLQLTEDQLDEFLRVKHMLGKIIYFEGQGLAQYIILQPTILVDILRSFITDEMFWPSDTYLNGILKAMRETGKIKKEDLFRLWLQDEFNQHIPHKDQKEFVANVLTHLDLLVKPTQRNSQESSSDFYLVPCMIKRTITANFDVNLEKDKAICLSYKLLKSSIPSALPFKLIGAAMNIWPLKESDTGVCLYHKAAILCIDKTNELQLLVREDRVIVHLLNEQSKHIIAPDIASCVQECLTLTLTTALEFYHNNFGKLIARSKIADLFTIEVGEKCNSGTCYIPLSLAQGDTSSWICRFGKEHKTKFPLYWTYNKKQKECPRDCDGTSGLGRDLSSCPTEQHLARLATHLNIDKLYEFVINLGLSNNKWDNIEYKHRGSEVLMFKIDALLEWKKFILSELKAPSFKMLADALEKTDHNIHLLCKIFRENDSLIKIEHPSLQQSLNNDTCTLVELSRNIGNCAMHLGVELGLSTVEIEETMVKYRKVMYDQNYDILIKWSKSGRNTTLRSLMQTLQIVDPRGLAFLSRKYNIK